MCICASLCVMGYMNVMPKEARKGHRSPELELEVTMSHHWVLRTGCCSQILQRDSSKCSSPEPSLQPWQMIPECFTLNE